MKIMVGGMREDGERVVDLIEAVGALVEEEVVVDSSAVGTRATAVEKDRDMAAALATGLVARETVREMCHVRCSKNHPTKRKGVCKRKQVGVATHKPSQEQFRIPQGKPGEMVA